MCLIGGGIHRTRRVSAFRQNLTDHLAYADNSYLFQKQRQLHRAIATMPHVLMQQPGCHRGEPGFWRIGSAGAGSIDRALDAEQYLPRCSCFGVLVAIVNLTGLVKITSLACGHRTENSRGKLAVFSIVISQP